MFQIAVQTGGLEELFGIEGAYQKIKEAGFDAVDANIDHLMSGRDILEKRIPAIFQPTCSDKETVLAVAEWKNAAKKYGLQNYQAHAPFPSLHTFDTQDKEWNKFLLEMLRKTILCAAEIECPNLIIHPFFRDYNHQMEREEEWNVNIESYSKLAATAKENGVTINLENMFTCNNGKVYAAICNDGLLAAKYIDTLNQAAGSKVFGFCLDTGHALLVGKDIKQFMTDMGDRITAFHVHDNDGVNDLHLAPYTGKLDWDRFVEGLKAIGYNKTLSFETFHAMEVIDPALVPEELRYIAACGRMFDRKASL